MTHCTTRDASAPAGALATLDPAPALADVPEIRALLQVGMGWLPQQTGGLNRFFYGLIHELSRCGVDVHSLVAGQPLAISDDTCCHRLGRTNCFAHRDAPLVKRWWAARRAIREALAGHPDLVASHFALYTAPALDLLRDVPLVAHFHGPWASEKRREGDRGISYRIKRHLEMAVYSRAERVLTLSQAFARLAHQEYGVPQERLRVVPGGIDTEQFHCGLSRAEARQRLGWPVDRPTVFCVRRLVPRMGIGALVSAAQQAVRVIPDLQVMIGGSGPLTASLADKIDALGLSAHVKLLGFVSDQDLPLAYRAADLGIVPSDSLEGFGLIVAESLAAGTPALVTPVGGLPEVVRGLDAGLVLEGTTAEAIGRGLIEALGAPNRLPSAETCRHYARTNFDWQVIARKVLDVYAEVA